MLLSLVIIALSVTAIVALVGMAFLMWHKGFGLPIAIAFLAGLGLFGFLLWRNDPSTAYSLKDAAGNVVRRPVVDPIPTALIIAIIVVAGLTLLFIAGQLLLGLFTSNRVQITSWPLQQEQAFRPFEERIAKAGSKSLVIGICASAAFLVLALGIVFGVEPEIRDIGKTMNMSNLTKKATTPAPAPEPAPAPAPAPTPTP